MAEAQKISNHTAAPNGAGNQLLIIGHAVGIAVAGGASPQTVSVSWPGGLPASYQVIVTPSVKAQVYVTSKTATGFNVVLDSGATISAGTIDCLVVSA
jgi:hypothetical protein